MPLLLLALFYQSTPSCLKVGGGVVVVAHVIIVSAQVLSALTLGLWTLHFGLGLDIFTAFHNHSLLLFLNLI